MVRSFCRRRTCVHTRPTRMTHEDYLIAQLYVARTKLLQFLKEVKSAAEKTVSDRSDESAAFPRRTGRVAIGALALSVLCAPS
jgi:hypothetical protein